MYIYYNTTTRTHLSKPPISGTELPRADPNTVMRVQPNKAPQTATPKRHRRTHRGRRNNTEHGARHQQTVISLLDGVLTEHEKNILSKGLKFVPTPTSVNRTELREDVKKWSCQMHLKEFFGTHATHKTNRLTRQEAVNMDSLQW